MCNKCFIGYARVSTAQQGKSGLGLDAQNEAILNHINGGEKKLLETFVEVESGKNDERPQLKAALAACKRTGATLIIAKLDRLSRNLAFIANLMDSGVGFVACDMPYANEFTIHILAAVAEHERKMISERTIAALKAAKAKGTKLGNPNGLSKAAQRKGQLAGGKARVKNADDFAAQIYPHINNYLKEHYSLNAIARKLNEEHVLSASGKSGAWTPTAVRNIVYRVRGYKKPAALIEREERLKKEGQQS